MEDKGVSLERWTEIEPLDRDRTYLGPGSGDRALAATLRLGYDLGRYRQALCSRGC